MKYLINNVSSNIIVCQYAGSTYIYIYFGCIDMKSHYVFLLCLLIFMYFFLLSWQFDFDTYIYIILPAINIDIYFFKRTGASLSRSRVVRSHFFNIRF
jgi:hypothetical protein